MQDLVAISESLAKLEEVHGALKKIVARTDEGRRKEPIQLRRNLAAQIGEISNLAEPFFATLNNPGISNTYREKLARMRSATASLQANWSAARLDLSGKLLKQSAKAADDANYDFVVWMRQTIAQLSRDG